MLKNILLTAIKNKISKQVGITAAELFEVEFSADKRENKLEVTINNGQPIIYDLDEFAEFSDMLESQLKQKLKWEELFKFIFTINFSTKQTTAILFCLINNEKQKINVTDIF